MSGVVHVLSCRLHGQIGWKMGKLSSSWEINTGPDGDQWPHAVTQH